MRKKHPFLNILKSLLIIITIGGGITLMAYPFIANYLFENRKDSIVNTYEQEADNLEAELKEQMLKDAQKYNEAISTGHVQLHDPFSEETVGYDEEEYDTLLSVDGTDIMGTVIIPSIDVSLPIYHGTSTEVLEKGAGHLEGTSLPIGGESTHCVLTGHTGLSDAKLFTDLTELKEGDIFILSTMGDKLAYEVDQIKIVEPSDVSDLDIIQGKDYCTLVTCTPYGVNSHRLLVRGVRTAYEEEKVEEAKAAAVGNNNSQWMRQYKNSLLVAGIIIAIGLFPLLIIEKRKKKGKKQDQIE